MTSRRSEPAPAADGLEPELRGDPEGAVRRPMGRREAARRLRPRGPLRGAALAVVPVVPADRATLSRASRSGAASSAVRRPSATSSSTCSSGSAVVTTTPRRRRVRDRRVRADAGTRPRRRAPRAPAPAARRGDRPRGLRRRSVPRPMRLHQGGRPTRNPQQDPVQHPRGWSRAPARIRCRRPRGRPDEVRGCLRLGNDAGGLRAPPAAPVSRSPARPAGSGPDDRPAAGDVATGREAGWSGGRTPRARSRTPPDVVRTDTRTEPSPTTRIRRPRPPSDWWAPVTRTSPAIVWVSIRTGLPVAISTSPETELTTWTTPLPSSASTRMSPLVVLALIALSRGPRSRMSPDTECAVTSTAAVASRTASPDMESIVTGPADTSTRRSPLADAQRLRRADPVRHHVAAHRPDAHRCSARHVDVEIRRSSREEAQRADPEPVLAVPDPDQVRRRVDPDLVVERSPVPRANDHPVAVGPVDTKVARGQLDLDAASGRERDLANADRTCGVRHRTFLPSARMASAASSALNSWRDRRSRISWRAATASSAGGTAAGVASGIGLVPGPEAQGSDERLHPGPDRRVADGELPLHVAEIAPAAQEALQDHGLIAGQAGEPADPELALDRRAARTAPQACDRELARADRAGGDDIMRHWKNLLCHSVLLLYKADLLFCQV